MSRTSPAQHHVSEIERQRAEDRCVRIEQARRDRDRRKAEEHAHLIAVALRGELRREIRKALRDELHRALKDYGRTR